MNVFYVLISSFIISTLFSFIFSGNWNLQLSGNIAMCTMLFFAAFGHFMFYKGMAMMVPRFMPYKNFIVFSTGLLEIMLGIGLLFESTRTVFAIILIFFFVAILPANIYAAKEKVNYKEANFEGSGLQYLWLRIPLQVFFVIWTAYFGLYLGK